jgi:hypothetical protein
MSIRGLHFLPLTRKRVEQSDALTVKEVVDLLARAYNQGYWDGCHRSHHTSRPEGLRSYLTREASRLKRQ